MATFEAAIDTILKHEGGYVHHPNDPGGETNYGICKRDYPGINIKELTKDEATAIYRRDYWRNYYGRINSQDVATKVFDMAVNMGRIQAHKLVQRAVGVDDDGVFGPMTLKAVNDDPQALSKICQQQADFYRKLATKKPQLAVFLKGWLKRAQWGETA